MDNKVYSGKVAGLRNPNRVALLEVERVVELCLEGITAKTMLDVGTGTAIFAEQFAAKGLDVTGVDLNPEMLAAAREFVPQGTFQEAKADDIPYSDNSFDLVFMGHVLHEVEDVTKTLREMHRVATQRVMVLEWPPIKEEYGPPFRHRLQIEQVSQAATQVGFSSVESIQLNHMILYRLVL